MRKMMRLDKLIEQELQTSRKEMKRLFAKGVVKVDGQICRNPSQNVESQLQQITVGTHKLITNEKYWIMNKPAGYVTANHDQHSLTVFDLLAPADQSANLYAVGRLDRDTQGLVFVTTNGPLGYALLHPTKKVEKMYEVWVNDQLTQEDVAAFAKGIVFHGGIHCQPAILKLGECTADKSQAWVTITEGKFHQVKKMFLACGKKVIHLKRLTLGPIRLGDLALGDYRALTRDELEQLRPYFGGEG